MNNKIALWAILVIAIALLIIPEALATGTNSFSAPVLTGANANALQNFMKGIQGIIEYNMIPIIMVIMIIWASISYATGDQQTAINIGIGGITVLRPLL